MQEKKTIITGAYKIFIPLFFLGLFALGNHHFSEDWLSYYSLSVIREPGYALLVRGLVGGFGESMGIHLIALVQNLLGAISVFLFADHFEKNISKGFGNVAALLLLLPHIATPLASNTHLVLTDTVMAEGVCLSLFYLYMIPLTSIVFYEPLQALQPASDAASAERPASSGEISVPQSGLPGSAWFKNLCAAYLLGILMCQFRGQMMVTFILTMLTVGAKLFLTSTVSHVSLLPYALAILLMIASFGINSVIGGTYQLIVNGIYTGKTLGPANMACNVLYLSEKSAGEALSDPKERALFERMYEKALEERLLDDFAEEGLIARERCYSDCHDRINYEIFEPCVQAYLEEQGVDVGNYALYRVEADKEASRLVKALLPACFKAWLRNYAAVCAVGFIRTVAVVHPLLNWYTILVYGLAVLLALWRFPKERNAALYMGVVLVSIVGTVCSTALIIECWARYVFYNMPFFYLALYLLIRPYVCELLSRGRASE